MTSSASVGSFDDHILRIVDDFLQTVVVVDDRAYRNGGARPANRDNPELAHAEGRGRAVESGLREPMPAGEEDEHGLDAKGVTDAFAHAGLVCSLLAPNPDEDISDSLIRTARRADLVVLDWVLNRDDGQQTLRLVGRLLADDDQQPGRRLRTIAIYTGQRDLRGVAARLREAIDAVYPDCKLEVDPDELGLTKGPVRAAVFAKASVQDLPKELEDHRIPLDRLPAQLRLEFARLTSGLVTGVALAALTAIREDTHRILQTLNPGLDIAYLGHRVSLPVPDEARDLAVALVGSEIRSIVENSSVDKHVDLPVLKMWLEAPSRTDLQFGGLIDTNKILSVEQVLAMLEHGVGTPGNAEKIGGMAHGKNHFAKKVWPRAASVFSDDQGEVDSSNASFAICTVMRTIYQQPPRTLQLGSIVLCDGKYRLCVQPRCDSVRLTGARAFPFLPLAAGDHNGRADFIAHNEDGSSWIGLSLDDSPYALEMISFDSAPHSVVTALSSDGQYVFRDVNGREHRWVAELKTDFAQRVAVELAQQFARVAVDEPEMLRLSRRG